MLDELLVRRSHLHENASIGLCCFDTDLRYVQINRWLAALNGVSVEEHIESHEGRLRATRSSDRGMTFHIALPVTVE